VTGRVALVTGAGRGLGQATAVALAAAGLAVAAAGRTAAPLAETVARIERAGGRALAVLGDVSDPAAVAQAVAAAERALGPVDVLVNCAAVVGPYGLPWEVDAAAWWRTFEIDVRGPFLCARAVLPGMVARRRGRIINVSSLVIDYPLWWTSDYAGAKSALTHLTRSLAAAVARAGAPEVAVFAFDPGVMADTATMQANLRDPVWLREAGPAFERMRTTGQLVPPERSAAVITRLAGGAADGLTGRYLRVYDDLDDLVRRAEGIQQEDRLVMRLQRLPP
jgi:NAD(P)-dependent dehydrogenase (short-subunit alcohol dehydrogenase family)